MPSGPVALKMWPAVPDAGTVATALKRFTAKVDALLLESVTTIERHPPAGPREWSRIHRCKDPTARLRVKAG